MARKQPPSLPADLPDLPDLPPPPPPPPHDSPAADSFSLVHPTATNHHPLPQLPPDAVAVPRKPVPVPHDEPRSPPPPVPRISTERPPQYAERTDSRLSQAIHSHGSKEPLQQTVPHGQTQIRVPSGSVIHSQTGDVVGSEDASEGAAADSVGNGSSSSIVEEPVPEEYAPLQYFHIPETARKPVHSSTSSLEPPSRVDSLAHLGPERSPSVPLTHIEPHSVIQRPASAYNLNGHADARARSTQSLHLPSFDPNSPPGHQPNFSPLAFPPRRSPDTLSPGLTANRRSPDNRPVSYIDLLNAPYAQQIAPAPSSSNAALQTIVGVNASLLDSRKTIEMYRLNVKKTNDPAIQYEFAVFMINTARETLAQDPEAIASVKAHGELISEARAILQKLADRSYPFAQYYLGDGYASGLFSKGKEDYDRAFPLFVAASKRGHAESGYRAGLCYEFGWGCRKDYPKAVQFYRSSAAKNHPGAATRLGLACLHGDMGLTNKYREGLKWLKRAAESADQQYNQAPFELGLLHIDGDGMDVFQDQAYAAQLFTQAAELGHAEANLKMGEAYEHGYLGCPRDPALSVHFYTGAAQAGLPEAMMALCAWYMVGAEPVMDKDECEAYEWAKRAGECGLAKAEYAVGYFTEMGIGTRRDPLEANVWYVRAADQGDARAKHRLAIIRAAASGDYGGGAGGNAGPPTERAGRSKGNKDEKECVVM